MKSFLSPAWPPRGGVTCVWTPEVRTAGVERWPARAGGGVFSTTGLQSPRRQDAAGGGRPAAPQARLWASKLLRFLERVVALARLPALTSAAPLAHSDRTLQAGGAPKLELHPPRRTPAPWRGSRGRPRALCASQEAEKARGRVGLCLCVSPRGFAQRQVRRGDAQLAEEGEVCAEAHGCRHSGYVCVCGRSTRLWVAEGGCECLAVCGFVDVAAFVCLQALLGMSACTFTRVCVCHVPPQTCSEARGCILVARGGPGEQTSCRHHHSPFLFLFFFYPFLSIDRHV